MAIKSNNSANVLILITDTTLLAPTEGRASITFASLHEQTGAQENTGDWVNRCCVSRIGLKA